MTINIITISRTYTEENIRNIKLYRKHLSNAIQLNLPYMKDNDPKVREYYSKYMKYWKKREKCCGLLLAFIEGLPPYDKSFKGFPKELEYEIEAISTLSDDIYSCCFPYCFMSS